MKKSIFILLIVIAAAALVISFFVRRRADTALRQNAAALQQQQDEIAQTTDRNQRLSNSVAQAQQPADDKNLAADAAAELPQLQAKAAALRSQESQLSNQLWTIRVSAGERLLASENYDLTNHNDTIGASMAGSPRVPGKLNDARAFTAAMRRYADENEGVFPLSLDQVTSYLPRPLNQNSGSWENAPVSGTNDFEIVYQGGTNELANIPLRRVALIRERQPWLTPDGKWARTYGFADGNAEIDTSDDNFQSWDALHIIPSSNP
jgi:hypothetical protein